MAFKVGVIALHSTFYSTMTSDFVQSLKLGMGSRSGEVEFVFEGIDFGTDEKALVKTGQKLLFDDVDVVVGFVGHYGLDKLVALFELNNVIFLYSDLGAAAPMGIDHGQNSFGNSLGLWESLRRGAYFDVNRGCKTVALSASFYDCGYGLGLAYVDAFVKNGGELVLNYIAPRIIEDNEAERMMTIFEGIDADVVLALFSGLEALEYADVLAKNGLKERLKFKCSPTVVEPHVLSEFGKLYEGMQSYSTWDASHENENNKLFCAAFDDKYERQPSFFALLGYENGLILSAAMGILGEEEISTKKLRAALMQVEVNGPRGILKFNELKRTSFNHYMQQVTLQGEGYVNSIVEELPEIPGMVEEIIATDISLNGAQWFNAYLCT
jgi:branched-chain amino acid transport system substrate-binding protein